MREEPYLIWSNEHKKWWCPYGEGYTNLVQKAGRYSSEKAIDICNDANCQWDEDCNPNELPILESIAIKLTAKRYEY